MRDALLVYGMWSGFGIFAVAGWMTAAVMSDGALPGAGLNVDASVTAPLAVACAVMAIHCLVRLIRESR